jgi:hypothetical protein
MKNFQTSRLQISPDLSSFFSRHSKVFRDYPNLWIKGGAARDALLNMTSEKRGGFIREPESPRDWDLVLIDESLGQSFSDMEDAKRNILPLFNGDVEEEDFEIVPSLQYYMGGRDISINQILINPSEMIASDSAIRDAIRGHISPTPFEYRPDDGGVGDKVALRSLLFSVRDGLKPRDSILKSLFDVPPFWILIFLFKAVDVGVGDKFFEELKKCNRYISGLNSFEEALLWTYSNVNNFSLTEKQQGYINDARLLLRDELQDNEDPSIEKIKGRQPFIEARLNNLSKALLKIGAKKEAEKIKII